MIERRVELICLRDNSASEANTRCDKPNAASVGRVGGVSAWGPLVLLEGTSLGS